MSHNAYFGVMHTPDKKCERVREKRKEVEAVSRIRDNVEEDRARRRCTEMRGVRNRGVMYMERWEEKVNYGTGAKHNT